MAYLQREEGILHAYDLTVREQFQGRGLSRDIIRFSLRNPRWSGERIQSQLRTTSYHLVADPRLLWECGYEIESDIFLPDYYWEVYDHKIHEDAREIVVRPIGQGHE